MKYITKKDSFIIETPKKTTDLKYEGEMLCHCVGSYIDRVVKGETQICFLRSQESIPKITIEIRNNRIVQAKGLGNRSLNEIERKHLLIFSKQKQLEIKI